MIPGTDPACAMSLTFPTPVSYTHLKLHNQKKIQIANDEQYQEIELFDKPGLFSNGRIARDNLPEGVYCYDLRGSDYDSGEPVCVEERVVVNLSLIHI